MTHAYINYPEPHITLHRNATCGMIGSQKKPNQRRVRIDTTTFSVEINRFRSKYYRFGSNTESNDMWLEVDFNDVAFEEAVVRYVQKLAGAYYQPIAGIVIGVHC